MRIKNIEPSATGTLTVCTLEAGSQPATVINAGQIMLLECEYIGSPQGTVTITYDNFTGLEQTAIVSIEGGHR